MLLVQECRQFHPPFWVTINFLQLFPFNVVISWISNVRDWARLNVFINSNYAGPTTLEDAICFYIDKFHSSSRFFLSSYFFSSSSFFLFFLFLFLLFLLLFFFLFCCCCCCSSSCSSCFLVVVVFFLSLLSFLLLLLLLLFFFFFFFIYYKIKNDCRWKYFFGVHVNPWPFLLII